MRLHASQDIRDGELVISMNRGGTIGPFGVIDLADGTYLALDSADDDDRLIRAATRIKEMRAGMAAPHPYRRPAPRRYPVYTSHCETCGMLAADEIHAAAGEEGGQ